MLEFYPQIKSAHIGLAIASGSLFLLRGALVQIGRPALAMAALTRYLSYSIDTALLTAAMMLLTILPGAVFANGWLLAKLLLLMVYVGLGTYALKRGETPRIRAICYVSALIVFACLLSVARAHHPLGFLAGNAPTAAPAATTTTTATAAATATTATRFATDQPLREGMARIRLSVDALNHSRHGHLQADQVVTLARNIKADVDFIFANCRLPAAADQALHGILAKLLNGSAALRARPTNTSPIVAMEQAIADYDRIFIQTL